MTLPPLAASERRLSRFAEAASWLCALVAVAVAVVPELVLRELFAEHGPARAEDRVFAALAGAGLLAIAVSLRRVVDAPREMRKSFAPLLWTLAASASFFAIAKIRGAGAGPLGYLSLGSLALYLGSAFVYFRASPGVNLGAPLAPAAEPAPKAVQLGVRVAPPPEPLSAEPKAAAGASRG